MGKSLVELSREMHKSTITCIDFSFPLLIICTKDRKSMKIQILINILDNQKLINIKE